MAAVTDLTWTQLNIALKQVLGVTDPSINVISNIEGEATDLSITSLIGNNIYVEGGVIKAMSILLEACRRAQETANTGKTTGERLNAFPAPTNGAPANNFVPVTRAMTARADLTTATRIVGTNV